MPVPTSSWTVAHFGVRRQRCGLLHSNSSAASPSQARAEKWAPRFHRPHQNQNVSIRVWFRWIPARQPPRFTRSAPVNSAQARDEDQRYRTPSSKSDNGTYRVSTGIGSANGDGTRQGPGQYTAIPISPTVPAWCAAAAASNDASPPASPRPPIAESPSAQTA